jgi:lysophospholipase L1-like esterase
MHSEARWLHAARLFAAVCFLLLAALMVLKLALMFIKGGETAWFFWRSHGIYAGHPLKYFIVGCGAWLVGWILLRLRRNTARDWAHFAGKLVMLAFSIALPLVVCEVGLRAYLISQREFNSLDRLKTAFRAGKKPSVNTTHPLSEIIRPSDDPQIVYDLQPDLEMDFGHHRVHINHLGLRADKDYPLARAPHSLRIVGIGDSGMFGWDVEQDEPYLTVLERNLNQHLAGVVCEVMNFAVPGYNTQLESETLRRKALAYQPDIVIVGWCENDFDLPFFMLEKANFHRRDVSYVLRLIFRRQLFLREWTGVRFTERRDFNQDALLQGIKDGVEESGVRRALQNMLQMSREHHFHLLLFGPLGPEIRQLCRETGVEMFNTRHEIAAGKYPANFGVHFMHPAPAGHRVLAEYLERDLAARGWLQPREP